MAEIPVQKKSSMTWLWVLLALILAALLLWWILDNDEEPVPGIGEVAGTTEGPITTIEAILASTDPTALVGREVRLDSVQVQSVPDDRAFLVGPDANRTVLVMLNEDATPISRVEGEVDVNPGQVVNVTGTVRSAADLGNNPAGAQGMLTGQDVYIQSSMVEIVQGGSASAAPAAAAPGTPPNVESIAAANRRALEQIRANPDATPRIYFAWDSAELTSGAKAVLDQMIQSRADAAREGITLVGFADRSGPRPYNRELSERRAEQVRQYLQGKGIGADIINVEAQGETPALVETGDGVREPANRRVRIELADAS